jgi:hypothetical protein
MDPFETDPSETPNVEVKFEDLVGEGKKYKDPEAAAKAIVEKDRFIERLKQEAAEAREAAQKRINEEEFLTKLEALSRGKSPDAGNQPPADGTQTAAVTPEAVEEIINKREAARKRQANIEAVTSKLQETFGDDYKRHVQKQAQALGTTTAELTELAAKSPQAFLRLVGAEQAQRSDDAFSPPPRSSLSPPPSSGTTKNYSYYQRQRVEKGEGWYFSLPVQKEIWEQAKALGGDPESRTGFFKP